jgi:hypothetical protein
MQDARIGSMANAPVNADVALHILDGLLAVERSRRAVKDVHDRLLRATAALDAESVPYAVIGGNAVMAWVEQVDPEAVRFTQDVDLAIRRADLPRAVQALAKAGFAHRHAAGIDMFLDGPDGRARSAVHVVFSGEKVRDEYLEPVPDADEIAAFRGFRVLTLDALVRMKLTSFRRKDQVHIQDMISVGLIDQSWLGRVSPALAPRLKELLDDPEG